MISLSRIVLWAPLLLAALLAGAYITMHDPTARDGTELSQVPLSEEDPSLDRVGDLKYMGGLDIPRMGQNIGGLSALRWDADSGRLLALTDDARFVWITPEDRAERLVGIVDLEVGTLLGTDGEPLTGKQQGDSESLNRLLRGSQPSDFGWNVGFERDHRILFYESLYGPAKRVEFDVEAEFGPVDENKGLETLTKFGTGFLACVERQAAEGRANCRTMVFGGKRVDFAAEPPKRVQELGGVPTDADSLTDGTTFILFRSYSPSQGNAAAIVAYALDGTRREIATFLPPLTLDNFEGLAVREEGGRTFLYIVSDDNFSGSQRTLLMKFEVLPENQ